MLLVEGASALSELAGSLVEVALVEVEVRMLLAERMGALVENEVGVAVGLVEFAVMMLLTEVAGSLVEDEATVLHVGMLASFTRSMGL